MKGMGGTPHPRPTIFVETPPPVLPPIKTEDPHGATFHEMIFSKFSGLQAYGRQLYYQINSFTSTFWQHFKPSPPPTHPMLPRGIDLSPPPSNFKEHPHVLNTYEKPRAWEPV